MGGTCSAIVDMTSSAVLMPLTPSKSVIRWRASVHGTILSSCTVAFQLAGRAASPMSFSAVNWSNGLSAVAANFKAAANRTTPAPSLSVDRSRARVCCRTGQPGPKQNPCIPFGVGGEASAVRAGQAWLKAEYERQGLEPPTFAT